MTVFGVTATRLDATGSVEEVTVRQLDPAVNHWIGEPWTASGHEMADMISKGDKVLPVFMIKGKIVPGPAFRPVTLPGGRKTIELTERSPGRTLQDLIHNVQDQS